MESLRYATESCNERPQGTTCKCATPWLGTSCNELCPEGSNGLICSGNGVCPGAGTGSLCGCNTNWYGSACETYCDADTCSKTGLLHTQCNPISGFCECQDSATGHWGGSSCDTCAAGWWGLQCIDPCECSGHGRCGLTNGVCDCFRDDTNGHWTGSRCSKCETGYTGSTCTVREAIITRTSIPRVVNSNKTTSIVLDDEHRILYVGSDSGGLHLYNYSVWPPRVSSVGTAPHYPVGSWVDTSDVFVIDEASSTSFDVWSIARNTDSAVPVMLTSIVKDENETLVGSCITQDMSFRLAGDTSCTLWHFDSNAVVVKTATVQELTACTVLACTDNGAMLCGESQLAAGWACYLLDKNFKTSLVSTNATGTVVSAAYSMFDDVALFLVSTSNSLRVNEVSLNASVGLTSSIQITSTAQGPAVVVPDPHASSAFVFWQPNTYTPGRAARVQYSSKGSMPVGVNSEISLRAIAGGVLEVVTGAATSAARRLLFGSDGSSGGISAYLMHEVMDTNPRLADVRGGTEVQVLGSGFGDSAAGAKCTFGEDMPNLVDNLTREVVQCTTGEVENEHCGSSVVQVALMSTTATDVPVYVDSSVLIERYSPPDLESIYPVRGNFYGQVVTIKGAGFKPSTVASCVYFNSSVIPKKNLLPPIVRDGDFISPCTATACDATYSTGPTVHVPATVVSDHEIRCVQPNFTGDPPLLSLLDFALDGQVYTGRPLKYEILGAAMGLLSVEKLSVRSDEGDAMRIDVYTVDVHERKLLDKDTEERNVTACLAENSTSTTCMTTLNQAVEITTGRGTTEALLNWPDVQVLVSVHGVTTFYVLFIDDNHGWTSLTTLTILHGTPAKLLISVQPEETTNGMSPLSPQPKLQVLDAFGFVVEDETYLNSLIVTASLVPPDQPTLNTFSSGAKTGIVRFAGVRLTPKFGSDYYLNFSSTTHPSIPSVLSQPISAALCPNTTYQETGKRQCTPCPSEGAICNGSTVLLPEEGYWRIDPASTVFYRCISKGVCLAEKDECAVGSGGALCQSCAKDYARPRSGRKGCTECQRSWVTLQVFAVGTAMLAFMCGVTLWTISSSPTITTMSTRLCVVRIGIIFLQMLGKIDEYHTPFPDPLFSTLFFFGRVSLFDLSLFQPFNCFIGNYFPILEIYILWPVIGAMLAALAYLVAKVVVKGQTISFVKVLATGLSISFYLSYPTLITHLLAYTKCNTYQGGSEDIEPLHKLWVDMSIDCGSDTYKNRKVVATVIAYLDGVVLPVLYLVLFPRIKKWGKADMLVFITGGYKESMWYWPVVVLAREGLVVVPSVYASAWPDRKLQHYLPMWTFQVALVTQIIMQPFQTELANRLETLSLACTTVLLNLSVLFLVNDTPAGAERGLAVLLSMLCFVCCWVFLYYLLPLRWRLVLKRKFGWERRKVQEKGVPLIHCSMLRPEEDTELEQWKPEEDSPDRPVDKACSSAEWTPPSPEGSQHSPTTQSSANMSFSASSRSQRASFQLGGPSFPRSSTAGSSSPSPRSRPRGASLAYPTANHSPQARLSQSFVPKPTRVRINRVQL